MSLHIMMIKLTKSSRLSMSVRISIWQKTAIGIVTASNAVSGWSHGQHLIVLVLLWERC